MPIILILFLPIMMCVILFQCSWTYFYPHKKKRRHYRFPRQYYLRRRIERQWYWSRLHNMAFYRQQVAPTLQKYQLWIYKRHNWKYKFLRIRRDVPTQRRGFTDDTQILLREKFHPLDKIQVTENPIRQFRAFNELSDPGLFERLTVRKLRKQTCKSALIAAERLCSYENATKIARNQHTVYFSRQEGELPIILDSGASHLVTPNHSDFLGPIRPCTTKELNGLNSSIQVIGVGGTVEWTIQDLFGAVRAIKTESYYVPDAGGRLFSPQVYFQKHKKGSYYMDHEKIPTRAGRWH
jgi:hypothetical protein